MSAHENMEHAEHIEHASHENRRIALLIAVLALFLAFSETLGKSAQTDAIKFNVQSNDLWAFYQAKTIRGTTLQAAATTLELQSNATSDAAAKAAIAKQIETWRKEVARLDDDPGREGRKQLTEKARKAEHDHETSLAKYHNYEISSALLQIGIVLASATIITGMIALAWIAGALGIGAVVLMGLGLFAPHTLHALHLI